MPHPPMTPQQKLSRVVALIRDLESEDNDVIIESRIAGLAKELQVNPYQCGLVYWAMKATPEFRRLYGNDVKVRVRPT